MTSSDRINAHRRHHELRKLFVENGDANRVSFAIGEAIGEYKIACADDLKFEARGVAVLGKSGAGKSESVAHALSELGYHETQPGDGPRPFVVVRLSAKSTLRAVCSDTLAAFGWEANARDSAPTIWRKVEGYMRQLNTFILVLDEIQHVRSAGREDREALTSFLKSLVLPRPTAIIPVVVGMPTFSEVLQSDDQLRRRFAQVVIRKLDPSVDLSKAIKTLDQYARNAEMELASSVKTREFAARLLHTSCYAFGEMCVYCRSAIKVAMVKNDSTLSIEHFQELYRLNTDCLADLNPFLVDDFRNIQIGEEPIEL